jgi:hypothetical protein
MNTAVLDYRISEFTTRQEADDYDTWLIQGIEKARKSKVVSHDEAMAHFTAKRAERLESLKNATAS